MTTTIKRARRMAPDDRKQLIFTVAINLAKDIGYYNLTRVNVAKRAQVSIALVQKYFGTIRKLQISVLRYAMKRPILEVIAQGVIEKDPIIRKLNPQLRQDALQKLINK